MTDPASLLGPIDVLGPYVEVLLVALVGAKTEGRAGRLDARARALLDTTVFFLVQPSGTRSSDSRRRRPRPPAQSPTCSRIRSGTDGSRSVVVFPSSAPLETSASSRRMIFPERVFGSSSTK